jgi:hypothetical protein
MSFRPTLCSANSLDIRGLKVADIAMGSAAFFVVVIDERSAHVLRLEESEAERRPFVDIHLGAGADRQHLNRRAHCWSKRGKLAINDAPSCELGYLVEIETPASGEIGVCCSDEFSASLVAVDEVLDP